MKLKSFGNLKNNSQKLKKRYNLSSKKYSLTLSPIILVDKYLLLIKSHTERFLIYTILLGL